MMSSSNSQPPNNSNKDDNAEVLTDIAKIEPILSYLNNLHRALLSAAINFPPIIKTSYDKLRTEALPKIMDLKNEEHRKLSITYAEKWCSFIKEIHDFLTKKDDDLFFKDVISMTELNKRFRLFSLCFHADKSNAIFTQDSLTNLQAYLTALRDRKKNELATIHVPDEIALGEQVMAEYEYK